MEIRKVQAAAREEGNGRGENVFKVTLKEAMDPRSALTKADVAAHEAIVGALGQEWGKDLVIIGEEDGDDEGGDVDEG